MAVTYSDKIDHSMCPKGVLSAPPTESLCFAAARSFASPRSPRRPQLRRILKGLADPTHNFLEGSMSNATQSALRGRPHDRSGKARTGFGGIEKSAVRTQQTEPNYQAIAQSAEFNDLRRRVSAFVFPMTALFLLWYLAYVIIAAYLPDFMSQPVFGSVNVGLLMGIGQFVSTVLITAAYVRFADHYMDPRIEQLQAAVDGRAEEGAQ